MTETDEIQKFLEEGFRPGMILRSPSGDEIRRRTGLSIESEVRALPLIHSDGRKLMYYLKDPKAIEFAAKLVEEQKKIVGYDLCVYCSGIGRDTVGGKVLYLDSIVTDLHGLLGWNLSVSDFPHTFEVSFKIETDDPIALSEHVDRVRKVALALSLRNNVGFVVGGISHGTRYKGQPFSSKWGLQERIVAGLTRAQLAYFDLVLADKEALAAARALQSLYCQVSDNSTITVAWAAIEDIFGHQRPAHLLNTTELKSLVKAVKGFDGIPARKRDKLLEVLQDPNLIASKTRNERIAQSISMLTGEPFEKVFGNVRALSKERGGRVHRLSDAAGLSKQHLDFVKGILWAVIEKRAGGLNPFRQ